MKKTLAVPEFGLAAGIGQSTHPTGRIPKSQFYKSRDALLGLGRVIGCAENYPNHISLPRDCHEAALSLLQDDGISCDLLDKRYDGVALDVGFAM